MSHSSINDKLRHLAKNIHGGVDNSDMANTDAMQNEQHFSGNSVADPYSVDRARLFMSRCVLVKPKQSGWLVLQRMQHHEGSQFIAPTFCETKREAEMYASNFNNVVAIMPIEWEE